MRDYITKANTGGAADSITATKLGAGEANSFLTEVKTAVSSSGQTLADASGTSEDTDQLAKALAIYGAGGSQYCVDTGAANAYVLNPVSPKKPVPKLFDGMLLTFLPSDTNSTSACTINYNSLGAITVKMLEGFALAGGELQRLVPTTVRYVLSGNYFEIVSPLFLTRSRTLTVGSGGNFATINAALAYLGKFQRSRYYSTTAIPDCTVILSLVSGFTMAEQVVADSVDLSYITISGVSAETPINYSGFNISIGGVYPAFTAANGGKLPKLHQLFRVNSNAPSTVYGVYVYGAAASVEVTAGHGVLNAGGTGLHIADGACVNAPGSNWSGSRSYGIYCVNGSTVNAAGVTIEGAGKDAIFGSASELSFNNARIVNPIGNGAIFYGCLVTCSAGTITRPGANGILCVGSVADTQTTVITSAVANGVYSSGTGSLNARATRISGSGGYDLLVADGGLINANAATYSTKNVANLNTVYSQGIIFG